MHKTKADDDTKRAALAMFNAVEQEGTIHPCLFQFDGHAMNNIRPAVSLLMRWGAIERVGGFKTYRAGNVPAHDRMSILEALKTEPRTETAEERAARVWEKRRSMI